VIESRLDPVMEMDNAVAESALVQQLEPYADIVGQSLSAWAASVGPLTEMSRAAAVLSC
jgi:hypothetical protein